MTTTNTTTEELDPGVQWQRCQSHKALLTINCVQISLACWVTEQAKIEIAALPYLWDRRGSEK